MHKKLRESLGEPEGQGQRLQKRNDRPSWRGKGGAAKGRKGEKQSVKWRRRAARDKGHLAYGPGRWRMVMWIDDQSLLVGETQ